jgi:integrase
LTQKNPKSQIIAPSDDREIRPHTQSPLQIAGQIANKIAGQNIFQRYLAEKSANTVKRHARDLELFAEYLIDAGIPLEYGADFQTNPKAWNGVTWGIVEAFVQWLLLENYAISSVNARLSTVRTYAQMAVKAGVISREEGILIQSVKGFSRQGGLNVDDQRAQTRIDEVTYAYKPEGKRRSVVVTRRSTKKKNPAPISDQDAKALKKVRNASAQAWRDALLMCLLLDHGLRASEVALLRVSDINLASGQMRFYRPKVKGTAHEWTTHQLTDACYKVAFTYINQHYPNPLMPDGTLILTTTRLLKNGEGGQLLQNGMSRIRLSERVTWLSKQLLLPKVSAHDCRHYCATKMARLGYGVDELMAWFGWTSAQTAVRYVTAVDVKARYKG